MTATVIRRGAGGPGGGGPTSALERLTVHDGARRIRVQGDEARQAGEGQRTLHAEEVRPAHATRRHTAGHRGRPGARPLQAQQRAGGLQEGEADGGAAAPQVDEPRADGLRPPLPEEPREGEPPPVPRGVPQEGRRGSRRGVTPPPDPQNVAEEAGPREQTAQEGLAALRGVDPRDTRQERANGVLRLEQGAAEPLAMLERCEEGSVSRRG